MLRSNSVSSSSHITSLSLVFVLTPMAQPSNRSMSGGMKSRQGMPAAGFQTMMHFVDSHDRALRPQTPVGYFLAVSQCPADLPVNQSFCRMSPAEFAYEHGRLSEKISQKDALIGQLRAETTMLAEANKSAHREILDLKVKVHNAESEKADLLKDLGRVSEELMSQKDAIKKTNEKVAKQAVTIKVQSDQIAQRASSTNKVTVTPHRSGPSPGAYSNVYNQPPPVFNPYGDSATSSRNNGTPARGAPMARQQSAPNPGQISFELDTPRRGSVPHNQQMPVFGTSQLSQIREIESTVDMAFEIKHAFILSENWARNYANVAPEQGYDPEFPAKLTACIMQFTNSKVADKLMSSCITRYFCVAKLINYQITTLAFRPLLLKGFTAYYDNTISELRKKMHGVIPLHTRRAIMAACAETFTEMTTQPGFQHHIDKVVRSQVHEMWNFLEPLFAPGVARNQAWDDLVEIWKEAARIGVLMTMKPSNFNLDYPAVGSSSLYNPAQMVNRDANFRQDAQTLSQLGVAVRLAITPVITETDYLAAGLVPKVLHPSNVLLCL